MHQRIGNAAAWEDLRVTPREAWYQTLTIAKAAELWIEHCEARHRSGDLAGSTVANYAQIVKLQIIPRLGRHKLTFITEPMVRAWLDDLLRTYEVNTLKCQFVALKLVFDFAVRSGWLKRNTVKDFNIKPPGGGAPRIVVPSIEQIRKLVALVAQERASKGTRVALHNAAFVFLGVFAGMRAAEIAALQWGNVKFDLGMIEVRHSLSKQDGLKGPKTRAGIRDIPMAEPVRAILHAIWTTQGTPDTGYAFLNGHGRPTRAHIIYLGHWLPVMRKAGLVDPKGKPLFHFHALRHAAVSLLIAEGVPMINIQRVVGHASPVTTLGIYGHLFPEDQRVRTSLSAITDRLGATSARHDPVSY